MKKILKIYLLPALMVLSVSSCQKTFDGLPKHNVPYQRTGITIIKWHII